MKKKIQKLKKNVWAYGPGEATSEKIDATDGRTDDERIAIS